VGCKNRLFEGADRAHANAQVSRGLSLAVGVRMFEDGDFGGVLGCQTKRADMKFCN
jgi:hypothetical protein